MIKDIQRHSCLISSSHQTKLGQVRYTHDAAVVMISNEYFVTPFVECTLVVIHIYRKMVCRKIEQ